MNNRHNRHLARLVPAWCPDLAHVYFIQCGEAGGPIKIGRALNPSQRILDLQIGCPFDLVLLASILVDDSERLEADLHRRYQNYRIRGEWFEGAYAVRAGAAQAARLASRQAAQLTTSGPAVFEWRDVVRESAEMPDASILTSVPLGSRHADPRKLRSLSGSGYWWRGKWRSR